MDARQQRGLEIARTQQIERQDGRWLVPAQSRPGRYIVDFNLDTPTCTCEDHQGLGWKCKHIWAVESLISGAATREEPATLPIQPVVAPRPTYSQDWPAYNAAQMNEKRLFQILLFDLCKAIEEPPYTYGRPRHRLADVVFSAAFKVYSTVSARRFMTDLNDAFERGYISKVIHYSSIFRSLENPALTPVLKALIIESSRPLKAVECDFATDSTGFSTSRFVRWFDHKYGMVKEHDWVKVHLMCGVKTNIVTAVEIHGRDAADSPQYAPMVKTTARNFKIREVSSDKAYSSVENLKLVDGLGATAFIPFKSNATEGKDGIWEKMYLYYRLRRDEFLAHYHKRSNIESTASMIKAKFRDHVRSKTDSAMVNEALCKILCHNICCLIGSMFELGVDPTFESRLQFDAKVM